MARPSSVLCPSCGTLVGVKDAQCLTCGRRYPGMFGFAHLLRNLGDDMGFTTIVMFACGALFLATLAASGQGVSTSGILSFLSPSMPSLLRFGASGAAPVFGFGRWWTVLSAAWLHGGILHILFNMMAVRNIAPAVAHLYGPGRTVIIYTVASATGFLLSSAVGAAAILGYLPGFLGGAGVTLGASASIMGLVGALWYYGRRGGSSFISQQAKGIVVSIALMGFILPGIDNWAHLGGLAGGYAVSILLDPLRPERGDHVLLAMGCLLASLAAVVASVVLPLRG
ncbi:MAG TPA: rhomboid family intramembrane serine protease [Vicinamibacteria bacterium]|nr:rhomboid family intramembrane serine protease [Vicinamibacteria bacterium]